MLSKAFYNRFFDELSEKTNYRKEEFAITQNEEYYQISLIYKQQYFFKLERRYRDEALFTYCPGEFLEVEDKTGKLSGDSFIDEVLCWLNRINQLYLSDAKLRVIDEKVENQKQQLNNIIKKIDEMPNSAFSKDESQDIMERLEKLENELKTNTTIMEDETSELKTELHKIQQEVEILKNTINSMSKKGWLKMFAIKIFNWTKKPENKELISAGIDAAQHLLPEVKDMIS